VTKAQLVEAFQEGFEAYVKDRPAQKAAFAAKQAAAAKQQAAAAPPAPAPAAAGAPLPLGTAVAALPAGCVSTPVSGVE
jgi:hypothetical protein